MYVILTDSVTNQKFVVNTNQIALFEPVLDVNKQPTGLTHVVFGGDMGRVVLESPEQLKAIVGTAGVSL